jgi:hypothetical protein
MSFETRQAEFELLVRFAERWLGAPARAVLLDWSLQDVLLKASVVEDRSGLDRPLPLHAFESGHGGHSIVAGFERHRLQVDGQQVRAVRVINGFKSPLQQRFLQPWVVARADYARFYRLLRLLARRRTLAHDVVPIMPPDDQQRLYDNTIGFLRSEREILARYGVAQKRGVLLVGPPGNGKTMACRWLQAQCLRLGLEWQHVGMDDYESARSNGSTSLLFSLDEPGIVLFDDFDLGMRNRDDTGGSPDHSRLLSELDGVEQREGVVYLFTTNVRLAQLDPAFLRRGRIDLIIEFTRPSADLRRRLVREFWHPDIVRELDVDAVVARTEGRSFAELDELKKLLVLHKLETGNWDWAWALQTFAKSEEPGQAARPIGFGETARPNFPAAPSPGVVCTVEIVRDA